MIGGVSLREGSSTVYTATAAQNDEAAAGALPAVLCCASANSDLPLILETESLWLT